MLTRVNYHSHTTRCGHASGSEEEFIQTAIASGYRVWGFADHCPWNFEDGYVSNMRMTPEQYPDYLATVRRLAEQYSNQIKVVCGLEVEYFPALMPWMIDLKQRSGLDYIIMGNHFDSDERGGAYFGRCSSIADVKRYVDITTKGLMTGEFAYLAHPDLCFRSFKRFDAELTAAARELIRCSKSLGLPLEYNLLGVRYRNEGHETGLGYPAAPFWDLVAEEGADGILGLDAHHLNQIEDTSLYDAAEAMLKDMGIRRVEIIKGVEV